ncbi:MAG: SHOCT domain-containing protein [Solirubrobacterales bacterium]|nr:SHOCT domain-containing protein [Solirubrobacterales bacterium]
MLAQLAQLGELRTAGVLTDAEFEVQKARILAG